MVDITETGPVGLEGLKGLNNIDESILAANQKLRRASTADIMRMFSHSPSESVGLQLADTGYGESEFDANIKNLDSLYQIDSIRNYYKQQDDERKALEQGLVSKLANGALQATVTAGTTFADGVVGSLVGLGNLVYHWDDIDSFSDAMGYFVDNPVSRNLNNFRDAVAEFAPIRLTQEQQEGPWYKKGLGNFIAQDVLSGIGFAVGAAWSGRLTASAASKIVGANKVRQAFKGTVVNSAGKELKTGAEIAKAYKAGDAFMDGTKLADDLAKSAKKLKNMETGLKIFGSVTAAMGEARIEALGNTNDIVSSNNMYVDDAYTKGMANLEHEITSEHPEWVEFVPIRDAENNAVGWKRALNAEGRAELERRQQALTEKYQAAKSKIESDRNRMLSSIFWANTALITASNMWSISNFIAGGFTAGKYGKSLVKEGLDGFVANKGVANAELVKALSVPFTEGFIEEGGQSAIAEAVGLKYGSELNSFYGAKINPDAEEQTLDWLSAALEGIGNVYGNFGEHGGEIVSGMLIGALGIPSIKRVQSKKNPGKTRLSIGLNSEFIEGIKDYSNLKKEAVDVATALNARVQSEDFKNYYQGAIRHRKYQNDMEAALDKGDAFDYKNAESAQFVSDAILFDRAGRLQDLYDLIEEQGNVTVENAKEIRELLRNKETGKSVYDSYTDEQIVEKVKKNTSDAKAKLDKYVQISNDLKTLYGDKVSSDTLEELTWMLTQVDDWEGRTKSIMDNLRNTFSEKAKYLQDRLGININITFDNIEEALLTLTDEKDNFIDEINQVIYDENASVAEKRARIDSLIKEKSSERQESGRKLGRDINHIKKVAKLKREELERRFKDVSGRVSTITEDKDAVRNAYLEELERLTKEMYDFYTDNSHYANLKLDDLRVQAVDAFEKFELQTSDLNTVLKVVEDHLYKEIFLPLTTLEGKPGQSTWESNRIALAKARQAENSKALFSQIVALKELLTSEEYKFIDPLNTHKIVNELTDLIKLYTSRAKFISLYTQLSSNPELFTETAQKEMEETANAIRNKEVTDLIKTIKSSNISSVKELRDFFKEVEQQTQNSVLEELIKSDDAVLSKVAKDYKDIEDAGELFLNILRGRASSDNTQSLFNIVMDAYENAESEENLLEILNQGVSNVDNAVSKELIEIIDEYKEQKESRETTKKDKNKPKKKHKKKSKLLDEATSEESEDENDSDSLEEEGEEDVDIPTGGIFSKAAKDTNEPDLEETERYKEDDSELEKEVQKSSNEDLEKLAAESDVKEDSESEEVEPETEEVKNKKEKKKTKKVLAKRELERRKSPLATSKDDDTFEGNSENNQKPKLETSITAHLTSWAISQYSFTELKEMRRMAVEVQDPRVPILQQLGAFDFVDNGSLGDLFNDDNDLPIHYISVASGPLKGTILLAVEVTKEVKAINPITAQDNKQYQVVGTLGSGNDAISKQALKKLKKYLLDERGDSADEYFVSEFTNKISHIYSGRMVKSRPGEDVRYKPLQDILHGETPILGVYYTSGVPKAPLLSSQDEVVPFNDYNENPRFGSLWLMTKEADGRYYAKAIKIARFHPDSYNIEANRNSPIIQEILDSIRTIVDPTNSDYEKILAKDKLKELLYFPKNTNIVFKTLENDTVVSITGFENNIGEGLGLEEKVEAIFEALQSDELNLRFQVKTSKLSDTDYIKDLLDSNILSTDLMQVHNVNASFDMYIPSFEGGKPKPVKRTTDYPKGHTGSTERNIDLHSSTVIHNGVEYRVDEDGVFEYINSKKSYIEDQDLIDEILFIQKVQNGLVNPTKGNSKLFIGHYSDGTKFGVLNNKVITGEKLEALLEKSNQSAEKIKNEEAQDNLFEELNDFSYEESEEDSEEKSGDMFESYDDFDPSNPKSTQDTIDFGPEEERTLDFLLSTYTEEASNDTEEDKNDEVKSGEVRGLTDEYTDDSTVGIEELTAISPSFDSLVRTNLMFMLNKGFSSTEQAAEFLKSKGLNPNEIETQDDFIKAFETAEQCK